MAAFTAGTTRVSNPDRSPSFRSSPSNPFWLGAFAKGSPSRIIAFYRSPRHTPNPSRFLVEQSPLHAVALRTTISQRIYLTGYERFKPNNTDSHSWRWCYRGGWHQSCPPLIRQCIYHWQKPTQCVSTSSSPITLACIVKVSRLLHPVGLGPVPQCPSPGYHSHDPYRS